MPLQSKYEKRIEAYIESNPTCKVDRVQRIEIEGQMRDFPVYRLPIKFLAFNVENGRFAADLSSLESDLGRKLNTRNAEDSKRIKGILLNKYPHETKALKEDLKKIGQREPGVATAAGVLVNANRRMAILSGLYEEKSDDRFAFLETLILPPNVDEAEIYKIEARLQYAKDFRVDFGPVNELLKMREGLEKGMTEKELAALLIRDEKYIKEHMAQLKLLEAYSKYAWKKIDYKRIEGEKITEIMTDVEKNMRKFKNEGLSASEMNKLLETQFMYIKSGCTYRDIREFGKHATQAKIGKHCADYLSDVKKGKISEESFKEKIDDINEGERRKKTENRPAELAADILERIKEFYDKQYTVTPDTKNI